MIDPMTDLKNRISEVLLSTDEFNDEFLRNVELMTSFVKKNKTKEFLPQVVLLCLGKNPGKRSVVVVGIDGFPETSEKRQETMTQVGLAVASNDLCVLMAMFQCEAWTVVRKKEEDILATFPSESPDRKEVLVMTASSFDGRNAMAIIPFVRDAEGSINPENADVNPFKDDDKNRVVNDAMLGSFFRGYLGGVAARMAFNMASAEGNKPPPEVAAIVKMMDSCPFKIKLPEQT